MSLLPSCLRDNQGQACTGLDVSLWDIITGERLGASQEPTSAEGWFTFNIEDQTLLRLQAGERQDLVLRVAFSSGEPRETPMAEVGIIFDGDRLFITVPYALPAPDPILYLSGSVRGPRGRPLGGLLVRAHDLNLGLELLLGEAITGDDGAYVITYEIARLAPTDKTAANLIVRVIDPATDQVVGQGQLLQAPPEAHLDLFVEALLSEYERLLASVTPLLDGRSLADMADDEQPQIAEAAGVEVHQLGLLVRSARLGDTTGLPESAFYGLGRRELPLELPELAIRPSKLLSEQLHVAIALRVAPLALEDTVADVVRGLTRRAYHFAPLGELAERIGFPADTPLLAELADRNINTLAALRSVGGVTALQIASDGDEQRGLAQTLDAHARLSALPIDLDRSRGLVAAGYHSLESIAVASPARLRNDLGDTVTDAEPEMLYQAAQDQSRVLIDALTAMRVGAEHLPQDSMILRNALLETCSCEPCHQLDGPLAYLADLLDYTVNHLTYGGQKVTLTFLQDRFHQPFRDLPASCDELERQVRQVRIAIEVLRGELAAQGKNARFTPLSWVEAAYEMLLERLGTSFAELRAARAGSDADQNDLARRLGLYVPPGQRATAVLANLLRDPNDRQNRTNNPDDIQYLTETYLEQWFGLRDSRAEPLALIGDGYLAKVRYDYRRDRWWREDWPAKPPAHACPLVDPDQIEPEDMVYAELSPTGQARQATRPIHFWEDRMAQIAGWQRAIRQVRDDLQDLKATVQGYITNVALINNIEVLLQIGLGIGLSSFEDCAADRSKGKDISADLANWRLSLEAFDFIAGLWAIVNRPAPMQVLNSEWADIENILIQHLKEGQFQQWRAEEQRQGISLSPEFFRLRSNQAAAWRPKSWRSDPATRAAWISTLRARVNEDQDARTAWQAALALVEERLLAELRNDLMRQLVYPNLINRTRADALTQRLQIDLQEGSCRITTRIAQAIETLQGVLFGARNGLLEDLGFALDAPAFDQEWHWIGSYATWHAAMQVFLYPENALRPRLRRRKSPAFDALIQHLDDIGPQMSAEQVASEVRRYEAYFRDICSLVLSALYPGDGLLPNQANVLALCRSGFSGRYYMAFWRRLPGWAFEGSPDQSFWREVRLLPDSQFERFSGSAVIAGILPYQLQPNQVALGFYSRVRSDTGDNFFFTAFDGAVWSTARSESALPVLVRASQADRIISASTIWQQAGGRSWQLDQDDQWARIDLNGDGQEEIVVIGKPRGAMRPIGLVRLQNGGLELIAAATIPASVEFADPVRPVVLSSASSVSPQSRLLLVDRVRRELGLLGIQPDGNLSLTPFNSAVIGWSINPDAVFVAADIDGDGDSELLAFEYVVELVGNRNVPIETTKATILEVHGQLITVRLLQQRLDFDPNVISRIYEIDRWEGFIPVRVRTNAGDMQDALMVWSDHKFYQPDGTVDDWSEQWVALLSLDRTNNAFPLIRPTKKSATGILGSTGDWFWHRGDQFIALDQRPGAQEQLVLVTRSIDTDDFPPGAAVLRQEPNGQFTTLWKVDREIESVGGSEKWSRRPGERFLSADIDGDGQHELIIVGYQPDRIGLFKWSGGRLDLSWMAATTIAGAGGTAGWQLDYRSTYCIADLDGDGCDEILVCQLGERVGMLRGLAPALPRELRGRSMPSLYGPAQVGLFNLGAPTTDLERSTRKAQVQETYLAQLKLQREGEPYFAYLDEAYFYVPLEAALRLRQAGDYSAALDWLRAIYNYGAPMANRFIAYKLVMDAGTSSMRRPAGWLRDPLDPHALAETRKNSYTRFTILSIVGCLLDYADAEFTRATAESVPRARELYLEALELLELDVLRREPGVCAGLIGSLTVTIGEPEYRWVWERITDALGGLDDMRLLREAVNRLQPILALDAPLAGRLAQAQEVIRHTLRQVSAPPDYAELLVHEVKQRELAELALLADARSFAAIERLGHSLFDNPLSNISAGMVHEYVPAPAIGFCVPPNPVVETARAYAELNLAYLRSCRNIAGLELRLAPYALPTSAQATLTNLGMGQGLPEERPELLQPLPYRYSVLVERARQLVQVAQQIEGSLLSALQNHDQAAYQILRARQDLDLARAGVRLKELQVIEAKDNVILSQLQRGRAELQRDEYARLLRQDITTLEYASLAFTTSVAIAYSGAAASYTAAAVQQAYSFSSVVDWWAKASGNVAGALSSTASMLSTTASIFSTLASYERRRQDWTHGKALADQDVRIGEQQTALAKERLHMASQDQAIAALQASHNVASVDFLETGTFGSPALYDWMSGVLQQVYRYFLQQATTMARLAEEQLAFERQQRPPAYIKADYWEPPTRPAAASGQMVDVRGLTGSARLLRDLAELDQHAFRTNQRKLQLSETISLAQNDPFAFQGFRETGVLRFATSLEQFDRRFPGHYLRLIRRVRVTVIALVPPSYGIRATLSSNGTSQVVIGGPSFKVVQIQRAPESIALTAPINATGMFELDPQPEVLVPFEGIGVDAGWEFRLPLAANPFDYSSIADVLLTIEYTALDSAAYRTQVLRRLDPHVITDRAYSFRHHFPDAWYDLNHPELVDAPRQPMAVTFTTERSDFPANLNLDAQSVRNVLLYFAHDPSSNFVQVNVRYLRYSGDQREQAVSSNADGVISMRRGGTPSGWGDLNNPVGVWELALEDDLAQSMRKRFKDGEISDILFVITYEGKLPPWPD